METQVVTQLWNLAASTLGRPTAYTPDDFFKVASDYFKWCDDNPWYKNEAIRGGEAAGTIVSVPTQRPYTITGLCLFAGITSRTFRNWETRPEFEDVVSVIRDVIYTQKFEGAAVGSFNANIIARDLGLRETMDVDVSERERVKQLFLPLELDEAI